MNLWKASVCLATLTVLALWVGASDVARADDLLANWMFNQLSGSTSFADSSGNGNTGTLVGSDSVVSMNGTTYPASPVGTGLYFNGLSSTGNYVSVPYNSALSGMGDLTLSAWIYLPAALTSSSPKEEIFNLWNQNGGAECYQFGFGFAASWLTFRDPGGNGYDQYFVTKNHQTPGQWMLLTAVFDQGTPSTAVNWLTIYENGAVERSGEYNLKAPPNGVIPLPSANTGQPLELAGGDNEWNGGLSDLGIWNTALTGPAPIQSSMTYGTSGGETGALYNTPTSGITALSGYGVKAMDQLFTLYDGQLTAPAAVTTGSSTLEWKYVAGGLPGTSGYAGQLSPGAYYVQLDATGGGVETVVPGDANLDGRVDINDLTVVLANYNKAGMTWAQGEFTGDGTVDINDLTIVLANYNTSVGAGSLAAVPEPASVVLLVAATLSAAWVIQRRRREA